MRGVNASGSFRMRDHSMALRIFGAAVLSALAMFFWGFVYWGPALNMTARLMRPLPADAELDVLAPLRAAETPSGMYVYPGPMAAVGDKAAQTEWEKKLTEGPVMHMAYHSGGSSPMDPVMLAKGFVHGFVVALIAAGLLATVVEALPSYGRRVLVLVLASLIAAVWTNFGNAIWWFHTVEYAAGQAVYTFIAGLLMALVTAAIVRPARSSAAAR
jgi:hypothetical protein